MSEQVCSVCQKPLTYDGTASQAIAIGSVQAGESRWVCRDCHPKEMKRLMDAAEAKARTPTFCCKMRAKFLIGIIADNPSMPIPTEAGEFMDFDSKDALGRPIVRIRFCPFCGAKDVGRLRVLDMSEKEEADEPEE